MYASFLPFVTGKDAKNIGVRATFCQGLGAGAMSHLPKKIRSSYIHTYIQPLFEHDKNIKANKLVGSCTK